MGSCALLVLASSTFLLLETVLQVTFLSTVLMHLAVEQAAAPHTVQVWPAEVLRKVSQALHS